MKKISVDEMCFLCKVNEIPIFCTTPLLDDGESLHQICESCADKEFPGWEIEDDETDECEM